MGNEANEVLIPAMLEHCRDVLGMNGALFAWLDDIDCPEVDGQLGIDDRFVDDYLGTAAAFDPLRTNLIVDKGKAISSLSDSRREGPSADTAFYTNFLARYGYHDEIDIVLRNENKPVAVLGLFGQRSSSAANDVVITRSLLRLMENYVSFHPRVRRQRQYRALRYRFGLTEREAEITTMVSSGAANATIAQLLGIATSTTKTHLIKIMDKLGAESRMQVGAILQQL